MGLKLYEHQLDIIKEDKKKTGLFLGTGSSKTIIALALARGKTLVICPKTQKEDQNWEREVEQWKLKIDLTVISKETFRRDVEILPKYDTVIVDEAHTCLGVTPNTRQRKRVIIPKTSQLFEALEYYLPKHNLERFYLVTATIIKSPMTVWGAGKLLGKDWDFYKFRNKFYVRLPMPGREVYIPKQDDESKKELARLVKLIGYVGRLEDFFDVPEQTHKVVHVELTEKQKKRIKEIPLEYPDAIVRVGKKNEIENGILNGDEFNPPEFFDNAKTEKILELALEFPRMVIFCKYRLQITEIEKALKAEGYKVLTLTGDTKNRGEVLQDAKDSKQCIFIAQAQISSGWELPEFPVMVFASRSYSFVDLEQSLGRIQRSNNIKKNLYIYLIAKGGVDEAVDKCLRNKVDFNEKLYEKQ